MLPRHGRWGRPMLEAHVIAEMPFPAPTAIGQASCPQHPQALLRGIPPGSAPGALLAPSVLTESRGGECLTSLTGREPGRRTDYFRAHPTATYLSSEVAGEGHLSVGGAAPL